MNNLLIPFGVHRNTGEIIEPEDAPKGRACDCLCPSCKAPLLCRHPKEKRDHFAHDSRHEEAKPEANCELSPAVAVSMMIREIATRTIGNILKTPSLKENIYCSYCGKSDPITITDSASNTISDAEANVKIFGCNMDIKFTIDGYSVLLDLVYKGKPPAVIDEKKLQKDKVALMSLDCDTFSIAFLASNRKRRYSEYVLDFILTDGKRNWRFHPKMASKLQNAERQHLCSQNRPGRSYLMQKTKCKSEFRSNKNKLTNHRQGLPSAQRINLPTTSNQSRQKFRCINCEVEWFHNSAEETLTCPECKSHLFAIPA